MSNSAAAAYDFTISFTKDMPVAVVEIVDAELQKVGSALMRNGQARRFELSRPPQFLRIHMPDGRLLMVPVKGETADISREAVDPAHRPARQRRAAAHAFVARPAAAQVGAEMSAAVFEDRRAPVRQHVDWEWSLDGGKRVRDELQWVFSGDSVTPFNLIGKLGRNRVCLRIPGNIRKVEIDTVVTWPAPSAVKVRLNSRTGVLNMLAAFLQNADMIGTRDAVNDLLTDGAPKIADPFAGCILGYLLLRLRRFDRAAIQVFDAAAASDTPDGAIIDAWRTLVRTPERVSEVEGHFARAIDRGVPVYTEGTRLLIDGLLSLGEVGADRLERFRANIGHVIWSSPVTTLLFHADSTAAQPRVSVAFPS